MKEIDKKTKKQHNEDTEEDVVFDDIEENSDNAIKKLQEKLKECIKEKQEYLDGWQRAKADFANARKKDEAARAELVSFAKEGLILDIITTIDNFNMAFANKDAWESVDKNWRVGMEHIHCQLLKTLEENGLEQFAPLGEEFNPMRHDSVESVITDKKEDDHKIIEVIQKGYVLNGKIIRPAKVKVGEFKN